MSRTNLLSEPVNKFFYGYLSDTREALELTNGHDPDLELTLAVCVREAFAAGARWELRQTNQLSPYVARFLEMVVLLGPDPSHTDWLEALNQAATEPVSRSLSAANDAHVPF